LKPEWRGAPSVEEENYHVKEIQIRKMMMMMMIMIMMMIIIIIIIGLIKLRNIRKQ
jgi:heme/copper-type cytochrome/quinol oxidase subunit 2